MTSGIAAVIGVTTRLFLQQSTVILKKKICLLYRSKGKLNGDVVGVIILESFKSFMVALAPAITPGMR